MWQGAEKVLAVVLFAVSMPALQAPRRRHLLGRTLAGESRSEISPTQLTASYNIAEKRRARNFRARVSTDTARACAVLNNRWRENGRLASRLAFDGGPIQHSRLDGRGALAVEPRPIRLPENAWALSTRTSPDRVNPPHMPTTSSLWHFIRADAPPAAFVVRVCITLWNQHVQDAMRCSRPPWSGRPVSCRADDYTSAYSGTASRKSSDRTCQQRPRSANSPSDRIT